VGYDSTNIYRIWIPSREKVIRTRDVIFDHTRLYDPTDLDIASVLREAHIDQLIETLELPDYQINEERIEDDIEDTIIVDVPMAPEPIEEQPATPANQESGTDSEAEEYSIQQLPTPSYSQSPEPELPQTGPGSRIIKGMEKSNILPSSRRNAHATAISQNHNLLGYYSAFVSGITSTKPPYRDNLPPLPKSWKQMLKHSHSEGFKRAADKEFNDLLRKETF
jgi:hypothetical protein